MTKIRCKYCEQKFKKDKNTKYCPFCGEIIKITEIETKEHIDTSKEEYKQGFMEGIAFMKEFIADYLKTLPSNQKEIIRVPEIHRIKIVEKDKKKKNPYISLPYPNLKWRYWEHRTPTDTVKMKQKNGYGVYYSTNKNSISNVTNSPIKYLAR